MALSVPDLLQRPIRAVPSRKVFLEGRRAWSSLTLVGRRKSGHFEYRRRQLPLPISPRRQTPSNRTTTTINKVFSGKRTDHRSMDRAGTWRVFEKRMGTSRVSTICPRPSLWVTVRPWQPQAPSQGPPQWPSNRTFSPPTNRLDISTRAPSRSRHPQHPVPPTPPRLCCSFRLPKIGLTMNGVGSTAPRATCMPTLGNLNRKGSEDKKRQW
jgi:hypothetical protein